jgi:hypothetical protein
MVPNKGPTSVHFHFASGFNTQTLAQMLDSLVRVSRRAANNHYASILQKAFLSLRWLYSAKSYNTPRSHVLNAFFQPQKLMLACNRQNTQSNESLNAYSKSGR